MSKVLLAILTAACSVLALVELSGGVRAQAQSTMRFEYLRAFPYGARQEVSNITSRAGQPHVVVRTAYRACLAGENEWSCQEFPPVQTPDSPLRKMLSTVGAEGWELVSVVLEDNSQNQYGPTYLFKRPVR